MNLTPQSVGQALEQARELLRGSLAGLLEAQALLAHLLDRPRAWLLAHPEAEVPEGVARRFPEDLRRLGAGEPLAYLTGEQEFFGLPLFVSPQVLIPRPETELLVETALEWLKLGPTGQGSRGSLRSLRAGDIGTGSGCIAVGLAAHVAEISIVASDLSPAALGVARCNTLRHRVAGRVHLVQADLLSGLAGPFDLLCANLPYIPSSTLERLAVGRFEPRLALDGGHDGLLLIRRFLAELPRLRPRGLVLLEIEAEEGASVAALARAACPEADLAVLRDIAGHDRLLRLALPSP